MRVERMARQNARSMVRPLGMERRVAHGVVEFWLDKAWWMLELQMVDRADNISRARIDKKTPARIVLIKTRAQIDFKKRRDYTVVYLLRKLVCLPIPSHMCP